MGANLFRAPRLPVNSAPAPERMHLTDAESQRPYVTSRRSESAPIRNPPVALAPERAPAARYSASDPIPSTATPLIESRQPSHSEEARSYEPNNPPVVHETTSPPESEATPEVARGTAPNTVLGLDTAPGPDHYETGLAQPEREDESHLASADGAPADMAASASHEAEIQLVEGFGHVMRGRAGKGTHGSWRRRGPGPAST